MFGNGAQPWFFPSPASLETLRSTAGPGRGRGPGTGPSADSAPFRTGGPPQHTECWPIPPQELVLSTNPLLPSSPLLANPGLAGAI